jgi:hypothetical protein
MKKIFIFIGLIGYLTLSAQTFKYEVRGDVNKSGYLKKTKDTVFYNNAVENWFGRVVTVDINVKSMNHLTSKIYIGGYDNAVSYYEGVLDFGYYNNSPYNFPLVVDTTAGIFINNHGWWKAKYKITNFAFTNPAVKITYGTTDSLKCYILFRAGSL